MRLFRLILISLLFVPAIAAQTVSDGAPKILDQSPKTSCRVKSSELPTLRGLRLDMPKEQVKKEYPAMVMTIDPVKSSGIILGSQISNPDYQKDIARITLAFHNDKVFSILLTYTDAIEWDSPEEFADKISQLLNLPKAAARRNAGGVYYSVNCGEFGVRTRINGNRQPLLFLTKDTGELWETTQEKKDTFKP